MGVTASIPTTSYRRDSSAVERHAALAHTLIVARERLLELRGGSNTAAATAGTFVDDAFALELPDTVEPPSAGATIEWVRASQIQPQLSLFGEDGPSADDVWQGELGDCYLLSALCILAARSPASVRALFAYPTGTSQLSTDGRYRIRFVVDGAETEVEIDDRLPCLVAPSSVTRPIFAKHCSYAVAQAGGTGKLWVCLVEKAYAKAFGGGRYAGIVPGKLADAAIDLTGCLVEKLHPQKAAAAAVAAAAAAARKKRGPKQGMAAATSAEQPQLDFFDDILRARADGAMVAVSAFSQEARQRGRQAGIIPDHVYAVLDARLLDGEGDAAVHRLLKLRNPHGDGAKIEWGGAWGDESAEWTDARRAALGAQGPSCRGTFWIELRDFWRFYDSIYVCHPLRDGWHEMTLHGEWDEAHAGGGPGQPGWGRNRIYALLPAAGVSSLHISVTVSNPSIPRQAYLAQDRAATPPPRHRDTTDRIGCTLGPMGCPFDPWLARSGALDNPAFATFTVDRDITWQSDALAAPAGGQPLFLVPSTNEPERRGRYRLTLRSDSPLEVIEVTELRGDGLLALCRERWRAHGAEVTIAGAWTSATAGGAQDGSMERWLSNPQYLLSVTRPMRLLVGVECAEELRRGKVGKKEALTVGVDVCVGTSKKARASTARVTSASCDGYELHDQYHSFEACGAVWTEFRLLPLQSGDAKHHVIVPRTRQAGREGGFQLILCSDNRELRLSELPLANGSVGEVAPPKKAKKKK